MITFLRVASSSLRLKTRRKLTGADGFFATIRASAAFFDSAVIAQTMSISSFPSGRGFLRFSLGRHRSPDVKYDVN